MKTSALAATVLMVILFVGVNMFSLSAFRGVKLDASEGKVYTLSKGSRNIASALDEKVKMKFYYSRKVAQGEPSLATYGERVREMLEEFAGASRGKLELEVIEPLAFSEAEDEATQAGLEGVPLKGSNFFLGLVVEGSTDARVTIPFFSPTKEGFLEYDIAKAIHSVGTPDKPVVGLISGLQLQGGFTMDPRTRQPRQTPPWFIMSEVEGLATVNNLGAEVTQIPADVDVLWVVHPKSLSDATLFAIDQFVMKGGKALFCVDPRCDADSESQPMDPTASKSSSLEKLLGAWGVEVPKDKIAADEAVALQVNTDRNSNTRVPFVAWLRLSKDNVDAKDPITGQMDMLHFATSGFIRKVTPPAPATDATGPAPQGQAAGPVAEITPLVSTTSKAMQMPVAAITTP
ncbi:MAG: GldG family protein, partial [Phycisphaerales bacterium]